MTFCSVRTTGHSRSLPAPLNCFLLFLPTMHYNTWQETEDPLLITGTMEKPIMGHGECLLVKEKGKQESGFGDRGERGIAPRMKEAKGMVSKILLYDWVHQSHHMPLTCKAQGDSTHLTAMCCSRKLNLCTLRALWNFLYPKWVTAAGPKGNVWTIEIYNIFVY